ncbi:MAG: bifunctional UDP-N-acetylmuramoyl-tripeptide:D-alanyl-D-alanine ligase/alanine racemase, partial [Flavobacteriales bacterium]|nr:bifunctional UDP-N-acetylmuramoyl-tripeptide:D-alanyl-D-alanine ligase/alanine racemase [Flavobacteriales bacterium]
MSEGWLLSELATAAGGVLRGDDRRIRHLSIDSRQPFQAEGTLFVALGGKHHDGHRYLPELRRRGVRNFLVKQGAAMLEPEDSAIEVGDTLKALQDLAAWHRARFTLPVIGITGSNGKTVVKEWLNQLLVPEERIVRSPGSWNSQVGVPLSVWEIQPEHTLGLFEAGISEPGEMDALERIIAPTIGVFTNIGPAHGAGFSGDAAKAAEKAKLFRHAETVVYCRDHAVVHEALSALKDVQRLGWGRNEGAALLVLAEKPDGDTMRIDLRWQGRAFGVELPFVDAASVENALHCIAVLLLLGRDPDVIARRVRHLQPVSMRMQLLP